MKILKILLYIVLGALILAQLFTIVKKLGNPDAFDFGFIVGKLLLIGLFLLLGKIAIRVINQKMN
ncbi:MAG: hypothetical protein AB8G15_10665 [Saprospiraceae bacterium]